MENARTAAGDYEDKIAEWTVLNTENGICQKIGKIMHFILSIHCAKQQKRTRSTGHSPAHCQRKSF